MINASFIISFFIDLRVNTNVLPDHIQVGNLLFEFFYVLLSSKTTTTDFRFVIIKHNLNVLYFFNLFLN